MSVLDSSGAPGALLATVRANLARVRERIADAGGDGLTVHVVAVTKTFGVEAVRAALAAGLQDIGENYANELVAKAAELPEGTPVTWHFLGGIQRNKLPRLAPLVSVYEAVDRLEEAEAIARRAPGAQLLVEVDASGIAGRAGVAPDAVRALVGELRARELPVVGLMTVAPPGAGDEARRAFALVGRLVAELGLGEASMGMSEDLELAVACGATMVRVGTALFGPREP